MTSLIVCGEMSATAIQPKITKAVGMIRMVPFKITDRAKINARTNHMEIPLQIILVIGIRISWRIIPALLNDTNIQVEITKVAIRLVQLKSTMPAKRAVLRNQAKKPGYNVLLKYCVLDLIHVIINIQTKIDKTEKTVSGKIAIRINQTEMVKIVLIMCDKGTL
jgi:hypothetical protein